MTSIASWLRREGANEDIASYAASFGDDMASLWATCPRADWLLAIAARAGAPGESIARGAASVVELARDLLPEGDEAWSWLEGWQRVGEPERLARAEALEGRSEGASDPAHAAALLAIASALRTPTAPEAGALAAALATQALVMDAGECAMMSVLSWSQRTGAERVRGLLDAPRLP